MYSIIEQDIYSDFEIISRPLISGLPSFTDGNFISIPADLPISLHFQVSSQHTTNLPHFIDYPIPAISNKFLQSLKCAGVNNFQTIPISFYHPNLLLGGGSYYAFNILNMIEADMQASDYTTMMPGDNNIKPLVNFDRLVLPCSIPNEILMFRIAQAPSIIIIHDCVLDTLIKLKPDEGWGITVTQLS